MVLGIVVGAMTFLFGACFGVACYRIGKDDAP